MNKNATDESLVDESPVIPSSFRDPSGAVFLHRGTIYRQINKSYADNYDSLVSSGLYDKLVQSKLLVSHEELQVSDTVGHPVANQRGGHMDNHLADHQLADHQLVYKIIKPLQIPFISYPYEWSFSQLKHAALLTLRIHKLALDHGLSLKDASSYNVQFLEGAPIFIDTLSFERYEEGTPWIAYRQFCQHFLAPLALMSRCDIRLSQLLRIHIDGIPLDLASKLLPATSWLSFSCLAHVHIHAISQRKYESSRGATTNANNVTDSGKTKRITGMSKTGMYALVDSLESAVKKLSWRQDKTQWGSYYANTNYSEKSFIRKKELVADFLSQTTTRATTQAATQASHWVVWDIGANTGVFSDLAASLGCDVQSFDVDPLAVEKNYLSCQKRGGKRILPLVLDITNPAPGIGWNNNERASLLERASANVVMALALIHHLVIASNIPMGHVAKTFSGLGEYLIIEFVPKDDSQVQILLSTRQDIFPNYTKEEFERCFSRYFEIISCQPIEHSPRTLYLMKRTTRG